MAVSNVAPPHNSMLNNWGVRRATAPAAASMSYVRTRVAMRDWWASRKVVSVTNKRFCLRVHSANFFGPSSSSRCRVPGGGVWRGSKAGGVTTGRACLSW